MPDHIVALVGHAAFFLTAVSFMVKDLLMLRLLAIVSSIAAIFYNYFHPMGSPDWIPLSWVILFAAINAWRIFQIYTESMNINLSDIEREIHASSFNHFSPIQFHKLVKSGQWQQLQNGDVLTVEGETPERLFFIQNGIVDVQRDNKPLTSVSDGAFIGEMSFSSGDTANATTTCATDTCVLSWERTSFQKLLGRNPTLNVLLQQAITADLSKKLSQAS
ncbi:MAG: cyclic nucleotide-binding domain-containing protein [Betaproteobacteria bacterium]|jgi:CRP/FNR family cyclic AMP-dependent transcriptional regulator